MRTSLGQRVGTRFGKWSFGCATIGDESVRIDTGSGHVHVRTVENWLRKTRAAARRACARNRIGAHCLPKTGNGAESVDLPAHRRVPAGPDDFVDCALDPAGIQALMQAQFGIEVPDRLIGKYRNLLYRPAAGQARFGAAAPP